MRLWLGRAGIAVSATATVAYLVDLWFRTFPGQPLPEKPPPRGGAGSQGGKGASRPQLPPEIIFSPTINVNIPRESSPREPTVRADPLSQIKITAKRIPSPKLEPVKVTAKRVPVPVAPPSVYSQLLAKYGPTALPLLGGLLAKGKSKKKRKAPGAGAIPSVPGLTPGLSPGLGLAPSPADYPLFSGGNYFDSTPSQNCDCGPKKKRKPKKKRTKCYTGRFTERANGLRKYEKRSIPCR